eukprot:6309766-Pyramimonas_sp.AAC.1
MPGSVAPAKSVEQRAPQAGALGNSERLKCFCREECCRPACPSRPPLDLRILPTRALSYHPESLGGGLTFVVPVPL